LKKEFEKHDFEAAIHLVGSNSVADVQEDVEMAFRKNVESLKNLIECCKGKRTKIIFASSAAVYGSQKTPHSEKTPARPVNYYGLFKYLCEEILIRSASEENIRYSILRIFSVYSKEDERLLIGKMFNAIEENSEIEVFNAGQVRDFVHIEDVIESMRRVILLRESDNQIINVGSGIGRKIQEITDLFKNYSNINLRVIESSKGYDSIADISKLKEILGISPRDIVPELIERLKNAK